MWKSALLMSLVVFAACKPEEEPAPLCTYEGRGYDEGETFLAVDGCNTCWCTETGSVACTRMACPVETTCEYAGETWDPGESFPAEDGCNTCFCGEDGSVGCTKMACECNPGSEPNRDYIGESPEQCQVIRFACPENTSYFSNACGCGCEQSDSCPEYFNCMPGPDVTPCDIPALKRQCPYSGFAF
jgi:hypothetical protein